MIFFLSFSIYTSVNQLILFPIIFWKKIKYTAIFFMKKMKKDLTFHTHFENMLDTLNITAQIM